MAMEGGVLAQETVAAALVLAKEEAALVEGAQGLNLAGAVMT